MPNDLHKIIINHTIILILFKTLNVVIACSQLEGARNYVIQWSYQCFEKGPDEWPVKFWKWKMLIVGYIIECLVTLNTLYVK